MNTHSCQLCNTLFTPKVGTFGKYCSLSCSTKHKNQLATTNKIKKYLEKPKQCKTCNSILTYNKRKNKFCSRSCAAQTTNSVSRKRGPDPKEKFPFCPIKFILCKHTNKWYSNKNPNGTVRRCSPYSKTIKEQYYNAARFKFNVYHFPEEFDLSLIDQYGWYTCPGRKRSNEPKNTSGVSRDHIISVSYGFENDIDPKIISHPANCRILLHSDNKKKNNNCDLTVSELIHKIKKWNQKYTERRIGLEPTTSCLEGRYSTN